MGRSSMYCTQSSLRSISRRPCQRYRYESRHPKPVDMVTPLFVDGPACNAEISRPEEIDVYRFEVWESGRYRVETGGIIDTVLALYDGEDVLAEDDDGGFFHNARVEVDLNPGEYTVRVWHFMPQGTGRYGIWIRRVQVA